jgi:hypothetical protein
MTTAGMEKIELAKRSGTWDQYDAIEEQVVPDDRVVALAAIPDARRYFNAFPASSKKNILWWIDSAKKPESRQKRVEEMVGLAAQNLKANHYRQWSRTGRRVGWREGRSLCGGWPETGAYWELGAACSCS